LLTQIAPLVVLLLYATGVQDVTLVTVGEVAA
jgi:hypothetical protein